MPKRIAVRYAQHFKLPQLDRYRYDMTSSITKAKICTAEFKIRWEYLHPRLSDDELFSLFKDSGFSPRDHEVTGIAFVRAVLQRYKDVEVFSGFYQYVFLYAFSLFTHCLRARVAHVCLHGSYVRLYDSHLKEKSYRPRTHIDAPHHACP